MRLYMQIRTFESSYSFIFSGLIVAEGIWIQQFIDQWALQKTDSRIFKIFRQRQGWYSRILSSEIKRPDICQLALHRVSPWSHLRAIFQFLNITTSMDWFRKKNLKHCLIPAGFWIHLCHLRETQSATRYLCETGVQFGYVSVFLLSSIFHFSSSFVDVHSRSFLSLNSSCCVFILSIDYFCRHFQI